MVFGCIDFAKEVLGASDRPLLVEEMFMTQKQISLSCSFRKFRIKSIMRYMERLRQKSLITGQMQKRLYGTDDIYREQIMTMEDWRNIWTIFLL